MLMISKVNRNQSTSSFIAIQSDPDTFDPCFLESQLFLSNDLLFHSEFHFLTSVTFALTYVDPKPKVYPT